jgi:serine/threonine-protein kinase
MLDLPSLLAELRRRRVFRALLVWGAVSFAVLQIWEPVMHGLHLPEWTLSFVVVLLGLGFPVTLLLSWTFDLTATGVERTAPEAGVGLRGGRLGWLLAGLGLLAAAPGLAWYGLRMAGGPGQAAAGEAPAPGGSGEATAPGGPSIAVLPFADLSPGHDQEYFSDGIAEEILNALANVKGIKVIGRTSSFSMKGRNEDLRTIGQRLHAAHLLEGSVRKAGPRVRITAQLIEAAGGTHLWSQEFDRELTDVFAVQEEIARDVVAALELRLLPAAHEARRAANPEAHDQYLLGLAWLARGSSDAYAKAAKALRRSVELDPSYPPAWASLAQATYWEADQGPKTWDAKVLFPAALGAAEKAIALAPDLADGYAARGALRQTMLQDYGGAGTDLERARALSPGNPAIMARSAILLSVTGRLEEALALMQQAVAIDPLSADLHNELGTLDLGVGQYSKAEAAATRALELAPEHGRAARTLGFALLLQRRLPEARAAFRRSTNGVFRIMGEGMVDHAQGDQAAARRSMERLLGFPGGIDQASYQVAQAYAWRGDQDRAFEWLGKAVDEHDGGLVHLRVDPLMRPLRADPRYAALLRRLKLQAD